MTKLIAAMNITLDGFCDHTLMNADDELHQHYNELMNSAGTLVYGRITYQLMENYWPGIVKNPTGNKATDEFAVLIDNIPKLVFSHTLKSVEWKNTRVATQNLTEEILALKEQQGKDIFAGSPSMILAALKLGLVDELQLCVHPVIAGKGLLLLKDIADKIDLRLLKTKTLSGTGSVVLYYQPVKK